MTWADGRQIRVLRGVIQKVCRGADGGFNEAVGQEPAERPKAKRFGQQDFMARYTGPKERIERRIGEKLGIKGLRSQLGKTAITKKPYPPGIHGHKPVRKLSEFGQQLKSKQKIRNTYRMLEKQFKGYVKEASTSHKDAYSTIINSLEHRLDNVTYRMGLGQSRDQARQLVNHGHILVNGRKVSIPSYQVNIGDVISVREGSKKR